ncbi:hypothetical protein MtrunA17_Chr8g0387331 [Medicago truncatula]|uniref:Uncharacterized protein n=1 Tax=Medicago truncatula TaxID=3880 RepID=A0A396GQH4_MEDTR|nr:hypothetical protein MtrunA17_Chr8g0387331 [Medicago truncatula]
MMIQILIISIIFMIIVDDRRDTFRIDSKESWLLILVRLSLRLVLKYIKIILFMINIVSSVRGCRVSLLLFLFFQIHFFHHWLP